MREDGTPKISSNKTRMGFDFSVDTLMDIKHTDKEISFTFPRFGIRKNPYMDDDNTIIEYPYFAGLIIHRKNGWEEMGFALTIDMDYKNKPDQVAEMVRSEEHTSELQSQPK